MPLYQFAIGAGHNVALGSLTNVETAFPRAGIESYGRYDAGSIRVRADGTVYLAGFPALAWKLSGLTRTEFRSIMTTYCNSSYSGKTTIYTLTDNDTTYSRLNAILTLPKLPEVDADTGRSNNYLVNVILRFTRLATAS